MKTKEIFFSAFVILFTFLMISCKKDEFVGTVDLTVTPNPVSAIYVADTIKWNFSVTLKNNTHQIITLGPIYDKLYDTDTQYTYQKVYYGPSDNWLSAGLEIPEGKSYIGKHYVKFYGIEVHSGKYDFTMTATGDDGQDYDATVTVILE